MVADPQRKEEFNFLSLIGTRKYHTYTLKVLLDLFNSLQNWQSDKIRKEE